MKLNSTQLADATAKGFKVPLKPHSLSGFAEAVYDDNSYTDVCNCLTAAPDKTDMKTWDITVAEWRSAQVLAIENAMYWAAE